ncbi:biotin--[acetyl-CoA-carboxylase] ligase [Verminephrobacter eiseniae]|uniref:biotin--[acetyl-CoA-carboxylase] ligase n=1 Tax=Verminephrobacter eiseniae TaxID=364317 RepID=UPI002238EC8A|nr:biotin--[acetyl-CoA-carboxylase] ligase [Verminephrobacter eiseniae]MCW5231521.1 biotin--[acetyl-CoA-carboxylase] ligase [Verminephrobacter eiseniae]MCW5293250.1 biotin--[acetyl-CoA-carboxylase] ligase [Verminephrobacter eiseniae]MCW8235101.1 biotin--[acetyl-CoA-carboxylase] ligase [Verminephrobacter eiseniae]
MTAPAHDSQGWPTEALREALSPLLPGFTVQVLPSIDSTNSELMRRARAGQCPPTLLVTEQQTAGRGRMGRTWHSGLDSTAGAVTGKAANASAIDSLMLSLGLPLAPKDWSGLSLAVGVSVAESLQPMLPSGGQTARLRLKWPNDLWLADAAGERKLGGILVETASFVAPRGPSRSASPGAAGTARYVVIGIGINLLPRRAAGLSMPPGSLQELEPGLQAPAALLCIVPPLVTMLQSFEGYGFAPMQARYAARDLLQGRAVILSDGRSGTAYGVAEDGALLVQTASGMQAITSADISVRPVCE